MDRHHWRRMLLAGALSAALLAGTAQAAGDYLQSKPLKLIQEYDVTLVRTGSGEGGEAPASYPAAVLYSCGLLEGTGTQGIQITLDVDKSLTRHEGVTMLVRLMGKEAEARAGSWDMPFTDVADWAAPYVGYAYAHGIAAGTSATAFSGTAQMSREQFVTMTLRALGWSDQAGEFSWSDPDPLAEREGLLCPLLSETGFYRGDAIFICYEALDAQVKGSGITLLERLEQQGAVRDRGVANPTGGALLTPRADTLETQLDYLREKFGMGATVDLSAYPTLTEGLEQVLAYCEERDLVPSMPAHMLSEAEEAGALSREERDALEEEMMAALQSYLDFLTPEKVAATGYSPYDYDRDFYLAQAEYLADRLPRAGWVSWIPDTPWIGTTCTTRGMWPASTPSGGSSPALCSPLTLSRTGRAGWSCPARAGRVPTSSSPWRRSMGFTTSWWTRT